MSPATLPVIVLNKVYYDTYLANEPDEAFQLLNTSTTTTANLTGWTVTDLEGTVILSGTLASRQTLWIAREADDFYLEFGFKPNYEYQAETDPTVPNLTRSGALTLSNTGDELVLRDAGNAIIDLWFMKVAPQPAQIGQAPRSTLIIKASLA